MLDLHTRNYKPLLNRFREATAGREQCPVPVGRLTIVKLPFVSPRSYSFSLYRPAKCQQEPASPDADKGREWWGDGTFSTRDQGVSWNLHCESGVVLVQAQGRTKDTGVPGTDLQVQGHPGLSTLKKSGFGSLTHFIVKPVFSDYRSRGEKQSLTIWGRWESIIPLVIKIMWKFWLHWN